jgi:hypothetical protein
MKSAACAVAVDRAMGVMIGLRTQNATVARRRYEEKARAHQFTVVAALVQGV